MAKESQIERDFITQLEGLKYVFRPDITDRNTLEKNFKKRFETLNRVQLSDSEFLKLREEILSPDPFLASKRLREQQYFQREDGTPLHYTLVNIKDWCKNAFEVIHQLRINTENSHQRYDVILLINGLPLVQVELKKLDVSPRKAMEQIVRYKAEPGNGYSNSLMCFMQLFIVSNRSYTFYFANNQKKHFQFNADEQFLPIYQHADRDNKKVTHLNDFSEQFLSKCSLGEMISKYMVLVETEQKILVMRPYQVYAVQSIVDCIQQNRGNGYVWHTTGSGKTLTSFKASTLLKDNNDIQKCLFVVDRKDLDRQTREEFNRFQEGSVEENTNTEVLVRRLLSRDRSDKVIVTTIQKLGLALDENSKRNKQKANKGLETFKQRLEPLKEDRIVFIFDECHRSQFGENHKAIKEFFPKSQLFGFTGTPIFEENSNYTQVNGEEKTLKTTEDIFQNRLHAYTITHAIEDKNVLRFHVDHYGESEDKEKEVKKTPTHESVVEKILEKHDVSTNQRKFNAIFATASINDAIQYYNLFTDIQNKKELEDPHFKRLHVACVFSPPAGLTGEEGSKKNNTDIKQFQEGLEQEKEDNKKNPEEKKAALTQIMEDYNQQFGTAHRITEFDLYYQDIQGRIKNHKYSNKEYSHKNKIDVVIVVDMLLTGFDSKYLNTLYVDKNLKHHGLIQAFSRTNRVLNDTKPYGNILDFRSQKKAVNSAISLFSGEQGDDSARKIWMVDPVPTAIEKYQEAVLKLGCFMEEEDLVSEPEQVYNLQGDTAKIDFVKKFKEVQRIKTQLDQYTNLKETEEKQIEAILPKEKLQEFKSSYLEIAKELQSRKQEGNEGPGEEEGKALEQLDLELVLFSSAIIDYDYIMDLIAESTQQNSSVQKMSKKQVIDLLKSQANLMDQEEALSEYVRGLDWSHGQTVETLKNNFELFLEEKSNKGMLDIAQKHGIEIQALKAFAEDVVSRMVFDAEKLTDLLEPLDLSWRERSEKESALMEDLAPQLSKQVQGRDISGLSAYQS
jgi:type I restriction enzyme R subunit